MILAVLITKINMKINIVANMHLQVAEHTVQQPILSARKG